MKSESHRRGNYHGISIFLPDSGKWYKDGSREYQKIDFASLKWNDFLKALYG